MSDFDFDQISLYVLKGKKALNAKEFHAVYDISFKTWHAIWEKTYQEDFKSQKKLNADHFTRQDEFLTLFFKGQCFAVCIFSHIDLNDKLSSLDSYFNCWPKEAIEALGSNGPQIVTCTQYTLGEDFRNKNEPWSSVFTAVIAKYFLDSGKNAMSAITRNAKGIDKLSYKNGGRKLASDINYEAGDELAQVDLVAFFPDAVSTIYEACPFYHKLESLWSVKNGRALKRVA
jgi:hypothetical protein